ncbi:MAG: hypothetical protein P8L44_17685 [Opitutales bacterium]|jgi:hypothetical protein|nr:hypothetical protein [Opitutales bacterium]
MQRKTKIIAIWGITTLVGIMLPVQSWGIEGIVTNSDGRSFEGNMRVDQNGILQLELAADQGSVAYSFTSETLGGIEFFDAEAVEDGLDAYERGQYETAVTSLQNVHRSRSPFFRLLPINSLAEPSVALGHSYLEIGRYPDATGVAGVLLGNNFSDPRIREQANEMRLQAFFGLKRWEETEVLAKRWCAEHEPFEESALGWWILSEVHLVREDFKKARWVSLQPITFSSQFLKAYLQNCYHVAIASWLEESPEEAVKLYQQYLNRGYSWPEESHWEIKLKITTLVGSLVSEEEEPEESLSIEEGAPKKDLNLPLETVRKLTTQSEPSSSQ